MTASGSLSALSPTIRAIACLALAGGVHQATPGPEALRAGLALFALIGGLWMTQALHLSVTALLVPLLAVVAGLMSLREALASFAHPIIFLFLGGFALAAALQQQGLDRALAHAVLRLAAGRRALAVGLLFGLTALLSMWISNTATAAMMLPMALGLLHTQDGADDVGPRERAFVLLGVAYSASIGGIGTLVGSPPNAIAAAQAGIGFVEWRRFGVPLVLLLLPLMAGVLFLLLRPRLRGRLALDREAFEWTAGRRTTLLIFALTAAGWMAAEPLGRALGIAADMDSWIAVAAIVALVATRVMDWETVERQTHWGVLLLFGGGLLAVLGVVLIAGTTTVVAQTTPMEPIQWDKRRLEQLDRNVRRLERAVTQRNAAGPRSMRPDKADSDKTRVAIKHMGTAKTKAKVTPAVAMATVRQVSRATNCINSALCTSGQKLPKKSAVTFLLAG